MSTNSQDQEIDLGQVFSKIGSFFQSMVDKLFDFLFFVKRNIIILTVLFIVGAVLGYFLDKESKTYDNEIIVTPNFGSVDYLYSKVDLIDAKLKESDTTFFNKIGIKNIESLSKIEIEPILDIYKFVDNNESKFEMIRLMAEDGDMDKIIKDKITSKNYPYHSLKIQTNKRKESEEIVNAIVSFLNQSDYFSKLQNQHNKNLSLEIRKNDSIIMQIDNILNQFSSNDATQKSSSLVYYNENNSINDILKTKTNLMYKQDVNRIIQLNSDVIIKPISTSLNLLNTKGVNNKYKLILPFLFTGIFMLIIWFKNLYKKQVFKRQ